MFSVFGFLRFYVVLTGPLEMVSQFGFADDVKTAIWPASVPILDGWREQLQLE